MSLKIYRRDGTWHYRGTIGPAGRRRRLRGSLGTKSKDIAARQVAEIEKRYWDGHFDGPGAILTFERACVMYLAAGKSERFMAPVRKYLGHMLVKDIMPCTIQEMSIELFPNSGGAARNRQGIGVAQAVINHAAESGLCSPIKIGRFEEDTKEKSPVNMEWLTAFRAKAPPHVGAWALFMFLTGARPSEALAIDRKQDLDLQKATVLIRETKVSKERTAHLPPVLVAELANLEVIEGRPLFGYRWYDAALTEWKHTIRRAKIERLTPHCCRHGFATELLRRGVDIHTVAWLGGWASPAQVLKTYGHARKQRDLTNVLADTNLTHPNLMIEILSKKTGTY